MSDLPLDDPLYDRLAEYPLQFAAPVLIGEPPSSSTASLANGTATLVKLKDRFLAVTCWHVVDFYRTQRLAGPTIFQIRQAQVDLDACLISEDRDQDLAVIDLTRYVGVRSGLPEASFVHPSWPPAGVVPDDVLCMAGYPGIWREQPRPGHVAHYSFSSGATGVRSVSENTIVASIEIDQCIVALQEGKVLGSLGGLSGGPVFAWRTDPILVAELVGFIYEYQEALDLMFIRSARVLRDDGTLCT